MRLSPATILNGPLRIRWKLWAPVLWQYYAFQYPLDFSADVTQDSCLMAANFRSIAAYFDQKLSTKTSNWSFNIKFKKVPYQLQKK